MFSSFFKSKKHSPRESPEPRDPISGSNPPNDYIMIDRQQPAPGGIYPSFGGYGGPTYDQHQQSPSDSGRSTTTPTQPQRQDSMSNFNYLQSIPFKLSSEITGGDKTEVSRLQVDEILANLTALDGCENYDFNLERSIVASQNFQSCMSDSDKDRPLLDQLVYDDKLDHPRRKHACTSRFLTMHKRRRKKLTTRGLVQDKAILDDVLHGQVQCILNQVSDWRFNAFTLETVTGGRSLPVLCVHLFHWYGLLDHFNLDVVRLWKLFSLIEEGYHSTNPYHNSIHATDVTQAMHCFLQESSILEHLEPIEVMASLIGAVTHDLDHPGVNQPFLIATSNHLAALYENTSVLENHHWRSAIGCLLESGVAEQIQDIRPTLEKQICSLILATDITRQQEFLTKLREYLNTETLDMRKAEDRHFILQIALKSADISNPCRPWDVSKKWSLKVCEEFFRQGDFERQLNLPVTSLCDRYSTSVSKIQVGFFKFIVTPLFDEWHRFLSSNLSKKIMQNLKYNQMQWENKVTIEIAEETRTEMSDDEFFEEDDETDDVETEAVADYIELSESSEALHSDMKMPRRVSLQLSGYECSRYDRRHSVPVNLLPKIIIRSREDMEARFEDSLSMLSSDSESFPRGGLSDTCVPYRDRPLSAETLVSDLSIATMSNSACADQLHMVMHGAVGVVGNKNFSGTSASKQLIRTQTLPSLQLFARSRYIANATDMATRSESLMLSSDSADEKRRVLVSKKESFKRVQDYFLSSDKSYKISILSNEFGQKENQDPSMSRKNLNRRRCSAPFAVALPTKIQSTKITSTEESNFKTSERFSRRGSMPAAVIRNTNEQPTLQYAANFALIQRRGSVPCESFAESRNHKKLMWRRSSGGAEIMNSILAEPELSSSSIASDSLVSSSDGCYLFRRDLTRNRSDLDQLLSKRRGSLPVDVLEVCQSATTFK